MTKGSKRITVKQAQKIIDLNSLDVPRAEIAEVIGVSTSTICRVLRQPDIYLDEDVSWEDDKKIGLRCNDCGVLFVRPVGYRCVCNHCRRFRKLRGQVEMPLSTVPEVSGDLSGVYNNRYYNADEA